MPTYQAETSILGSILLDDTLFKELQITPEYFAYEQHQRIFKTMQEAMKERGAIDIVILVDFLREQTQFGDVEYYTKLVDSVTTTVTFKHHEQILIEYYQIRKATVAAERYLFHQSVDGMHLLLKELMRLADNTVNAKTSEKTTYDNLIEITEELMEPEEDTLGTLTSWNGFDQMTGGFQAGDLIILAARPSMGKTAFALNLAAAHCRKGGKTQVYSLEMGTKQLLKRMISAEGSINGSKWRDIRNRFTADDYQHAMEAIGEISNWKIEISEAKHTITEIRAMIRKQVMQEPEEKHLVLIDYLQLIAPAMQRKDRRDLEIGEITRELKLLALELEIPIILLSQLSRGVDSRNDKRPILSDLRESGNIEQDADVVSFLYRADYYNKNADEKNKLEVIIAKHRNGPTGTVELDFLREYGKVSE